MGRRKGEDTPAMKRRRMPHAVIVNRDGPFRSADRERIEQHCLRLTNGQEFYSSSKWHEDRDVAVFHFPEAHQAAAFKDWAWRERIAELPMPKFGPSAEEKAAFEELAIRWGLRTGALRRVVQANRRAYQTGASLLQCHTAAQKALRPFLPPDASFFDMAQVMVSWAMRKHPSWFHGHRREMLPPEDFPPEEAYPHSD